MPRISYSDPDAEAEYQRIGAQSSKPSADVGVRPEASFGGRSIVEVNNPNLGPSDSELEKRKSEMEQARRRK